MQSRPSRSEGSPDEASSRRRRDCSLVLRHRGLGAERRRQHPGYGHVRWQFAINALYQLPADFEVGASVFARQGYLFPLYLRLSAGMDGTAEALAVPRIDTLRYDSVWDADFRLANNVKIGGKSTLQLSLDLF